MLSCMGHAGGEGDGIRRNQVLYSRANAQHGVSPRICGETDRAGNGSADVRVHISPHHANR
jgi:hypothetical protein